MNPRDTTTGLLVDADNVTSACVDQAVARMTQEGRFLLRRAYGGHEKLAGMKDCLLRHGLRGMVNHGKGTTDALLVVDAMDLLYAGGLPDVVGIASSDADFAPLAVRLRESGRRVLCFAHEGKSADTELARCYDELIYVDEQAPAAPAKRARKTTPRSKPAAQLAVSLSEAEPQPAVSRSEPALQPAAPRGRPALQPAAPRGRPAPRPAAPPPDPLRQVLGGIAGFEDGRWVELNDVVKRLRDARLLGKSASGPRFLAKNAPYVELVPAAHPTRLRLAGG